jgi:GMP synthase-like glutamine amidotransferase
MNEKVKPIKILIIDNNREENSYGSSDLVSWAVKTAPAGSEIVVRRSPDHDLPKHDFNVDAIVISGSITSCMEFEESWIKPYDDFVTAHIKKGTPILGVCYGHQTIARCLERMHGQEPKLRKAKDAELGWQEVLITDQTLLLEGLNGQFYTYQSHYEEVYELPPGAKKFAETERCALQGFQVHDKPIFGIQFHPEYSVEDAEASIARKIKRGEPAHWILNAGKGKSLYDENVGKVIFGNFFRIANSQQ